MTPPACRNCGIQVCRGQILTIDADLVAVHVNCADAFLYADNRDGAVIEQQVSAAAVAGERARIKAVIDAAKGHPSMCAAIQLALTSSMSPDEIANFVSNHSAAIAQAPRSSVSSIADRAAAHDLSFSQPLPRPSSGWDLAIAKHCHQERVSQ